MGMTPVGGPWWAIGCDEDGYYAELVVGFDDAGVPLTWSRVSARVLPATDLDGFETIEAGSREGIVERVEQLQLGRA